VVCQNILICECIKFRGYKFSWFNLDKPPSKVELLAVDAWSLAYGVKSCGGLSWIVLQSYHVVISRRTSVHWKSSGVARPGQAWAMPGHQATLPYHPAQSNQGVS